MNLYMTPVQYPYISTQFEPPGDYCDNGQIISSGCINLESWLKCNMPIKFLIHKVARCFNVISDRQLKLAYLYVFVNLERRSPEKFLLFILLNSVERMPFFAMLVKYSANSFHDICANCVNIPIPTRVYKFFNDTFCMKVSSEMYALCGLIYNTSYNKRFLLSVLSNTIRNHPGLSELRVQRKNILEECLCN